MKKKLITIGWQEWVALPKLHLPAIKAKIDTGAKTSSLHAFDIEEVRRNGKDCVRFSVHPIQGNRKIEVSCCAPVIDCRNVMSSNGHYELRYVIESTLSLAGSSWPIELTLSNRDPLRFRMLLGREALRGHTLIQPSARLLTDSRSKEEAMRLYKKRSRNK